MKKNLIITGGTGFLGTHVSKYLSAKYNLILISRQPYQNILPHTRQLYWKVSDPTPKSLLKIFEENNISAVIHMATAYGRRNTELENVLDANITLPARLIKLCIDYGTSLFINTDTYYNKKGVVYSPLPTYSLTKKSIKFWLDFYQKDIKIVNISLEHIYGPNDGLDKFIPAIILKMLNHSPEINLTHGHQKRDFIFIDDVVEAYDLVLKNSLDEKFRVREYQIGTGESISIRALVESLAAHLNYSGRLNFGALEYADDEIMNSYADLSAITHLGFKPKFDLNSGLKSTIKELK